VKRERERERDRERETETERETERERERQRQRDRETEKVVGTKDMYVCGHVIAADLHGPLQAVVVRLMVIEEDDLESIGEE
jgi:hypothetical protein